MSLFDPDFLRLECLKLAVEACHSAEDVVKYAQLFEAFTKGKGEPSGDATLKHPPRNAPTGITQTNRNAVGTSP